MEARTADLHAQAAGKREEALREQAKEMGREVDAEHDLLSLEELIAIRLFTGPGFYVINEFLRQLAELAPPYRRRIASQRGVTYSDTCRNLVNGIRKLARFTSVPTQARHTRHLIQPDQTLRVFMHINERERLRHIIIGAAGLGPPMRKPQRDNAPSGHARVMQRHGWRGLRRRHAGRLNSAPHKRHGSRIGGFL